MLKRLSSVSSLLLLALGSACGSPSAPPDPGQAPPPIIVTKLPEGPEKSGSDVKLAWVQTDGGARVKEGQNVYAEALSNTYAQPVYCAFGPLAQPSDVRLTCVPQYPAAVVDMVANLYADGTCSDDARLIVESPSARQCQVGKLLFGVLAPQGSDVCHRSFVVREVQPIATPMQTFVLQNGKCTMDLPGKANLNYFLLGRTLDSSELPQGRRGVESTSTEP
jgi:hypothetical protein